MPLLMGMAIIQRNTTSPNQARKEMYVDFDKFIELSTGVWPTSLTEDQWNMALGTRVTKPSELITTVALLYPIATDQKHKSEIFTPEGIKHPCDLGLESEAN